MGRLDWTIAGVKGPKHYFRHGNSRIACGPYWPSVLSPNPAAGGTVNGGDPINLATGQHAYLPAPDIVVYNPNGPAAVYQRNWWSERAMDEGSTHPPASPTTV